MNVKNLKDPKATSKLLMRSTLYRKLPELRHQLLKSYYLQTPKFAFPICFTYFLDIIHPIKT